MPKLTRRRSPRVRRRHGPTPATRLRDRRDVAAKRLTMTSPVAALWPGNVTFRIGSGIRQGARQRHMNQCAETVELGRLARAANWADPDRDGRWSRLCTDSRVLNRRRVPRSPGATPAPIGVPASAPGLAGFATTSEANEARPVETTKLAEYGPNARAGGRPRSTDPVRSVPSPKRVAKTGLVSAIRPACEPGTVVGAICVAACVGMVRRSRSCARPRVQC
jgi:hypothetical protein